jgi:hypothetical protein
MVYSPETGRIYNIAEQGRIKKVESLDWTSVRQLKHSLAPYKTEFSRFYDGFLEFPEDPASRDKQNCHVAVFGSCEGESILVANWIFVHRNELQQLLNLNVRSLSWIASDIAPVGHYVNGILKTRATGFGSWVIVGNSVRLQYCTSVSLLMNSLDCAGMEIIQVNYDIKENNVIIYESVTTQPEMIECRKVPAGHGQVHNGGLFRWALTEHLVFLP